MDYQLPFFSFSLFSPLSPTCLPASIINPIEEKGGKRSTRCVDLSLFPPLFFPKQFAVSFDLSQGQGGGLV